MARVIVDTWFATHAGQVSADVLRRRRQEWGYRESEQGWQRAISDADGWSSVVLVTTNSQRILGVAASELTGTDSAEVGALYVDIEHQRTGIGRALLQELLNHYRDLGISTVSVAVLATNRGARRFYERLGGQVSGAREHEDGPEVVYQWRLPVERDN